MMKFERCKGFRDLSPGEMEKFRIVEDAFRQSCIRWGYEEVRTPTLEYLHLFTSTGTLTPGLLNRVYSFLDWDGWSGERVVLRPDGTIPIARLYIDSFKEQTLAKLFYVTNIFIFEETGKEYREKWQGGVELIGKGSPLADVVLISMAIEVLRNLNLNNVSLKLSHAGVIKALLAELGLSHEEQNILFDKILDGDLEALTNINPEKSGVGKIITALLDFKGNSAALLLNLKSLYENELPGLSQPLNDFINVVNFLDSMKIDYKIDMDTGRGFEYYTGIIFHLSVNGQDVVGGGRYDGLIPFMSGRNVPASGFALYIDRLLDLINLDVLSSSVKNQRILIKVDIEKSDLVQIGFRLINAIHQTGVAAEILPAEKEQPKHRWIIEIQGIDNIILINTPNKKKYNVSNENEVLKILKNERNNTRRIAERSPAL